MYHTHACRNIITVFVLLFKAKVVYRSGQWCLVCLSSFTDFRFPLLLRRRNLGSCLSVLISERRLRFPFVMENTRKYCPGATRKIFTSIFKVRRGGEGRECHVGMFCFVPVTSFGQGESRQALFFVFVGLCFS